MPLATPSFRNRPPSLSLPMRRLLSLALVVAASSALLACQGEVRRALPSGVDREVRAEAKLCENGDQIACHNVALTIEFHPGSTAAQKDFAQRLLVAACEDGVELSCRRLADQAREQGDDPMAGEEILQRSCSRGDVDACVVLAFQRIEAGKLEQGLHELLTLCHEGSSRACVELGRHHLVGTSGTPNPTAAEEILSLPCAQGSPVACRLRAEAQLLRAQSPESISTQTISLLGEACLGADELACRRLSGLYHAGVGVEQDQEYAQTLLQRACALDYKTENCGVMTPAPTYDRDDDAEPTPDAP